MRVGDILECIAKIQRHTHGYDFDDFEGDDKTIDSVLRNLEVSGPREFHPRALSEPDMNLSAHPAPIIQP